MKLILTILTLLIAQPVWGATYYALTDGTNADPDCSESSACCAGAMDESDITAASFSAGDIIYFCDTSGAFSDIILPSSSGTAGSKITYAAYTGDTPVINAASDRAFSVPIGVHDLVLDGFTLSTITGGTRRGLYLYYDTYNIEIKNWIFNDTTATAVEYAIQIVLNENNMSGISIHDCTFDMNETYSVGISFYQYTTDPNTPTFQDFDIYNNTFEDLRWSIQTIMNAGDAAWILANDLRIQDVDIYSNTSTDTLYGFISTGMGGKDLAVYNNSITDCGDSGTANVNCFQLSWIEDSNIYNNTIDGINTSVCDGAGIILDHNDNDTSYISNNNLIYNNYIKDANAACGGKGISVYKGTNNQIYENISTGSTWAAFQVVNDESTGNVFYNNTAYNSAHCLNAQDSDNIGQSSTWRNNIASTCSGHGFRAVNNAVIVESNNLLFDVTSNDIEPDSTDKVDLYGIDSTVDPLFASAANNIFRLTASSPAINAGTDVGLSTDFYGRTIDSSPDIGASEYQADYGTYTDLFYITADGSGSKDGLRLADAFSPTEFNTAGNWDTDNAVDGKVGALDVVYFYDDDGDITTALVVQQDGLTGAPITLMAYPGETPVINAPGADYGLKLGHKDFITIDGLTIYGSDDGGSDGSSIYIEDAHDVIIQNVTISNPVAGQEHGITVLVWDGNVYNITVSNVTFNYTGNTTVDGLRVLLYGQSVATFYDFTLQNSTFIEGEDGMEIWGSSMANVDAVGAPYGIDINGNTFTDQLRFPIHMHAGIAATGDSYIRNNTITDGGDDAQANTNGIQCNWCRDVIIEDNSINGHAVSTNGDGHGIIIDWAFTDNDHISEGCIVRNNTVTGCNDSTATRASGIQVFKGTNTQIYGNLLYGNKVGISIEKEESTGTTLYNNTLYNNSYANGLIRQAAPASVWTNNIFSTSNYNLLVENVDTVEPTISNNLYHAATTENRYNSYAPAHTIDAGTGAVSADPEFINP